ncbi:type IV secretory system conjugative DNA transfer family protein [Paenibacillus sp. HGF7]|uniref:type IV secretory system conjugative DNA transfer family protein n=1 Tax=Paenibacillus sp. HGF7 TaxID=944559 RepID=UPI00020D6BD1|nr:type IV secretory system conjugative DNA transfer family protein [Paenibacillus sp. HGF7]EGL17083.1 hypothetical protein HMPREF9413_2611 [Paenibacillus sp. HGF7]
MDTAVLGLLGVGVIVGGSLYLESKNPKLRNKETKDYRYIRLLPHVENQLNLNDIMRMVEQFAGYSRTKKERAQKGREWFRFLIHRSEEGIEFYFGYPQDRETGVKRTFEVTYPKSEQHAIKHRELPLPQNNKGYGGSFRIARDGEYEGLPLRPFDAKYDEWGDVLLYMQPGTWIDLVLSGATHTDLKNAIKKTQSKMLPKDRSESGSMYKTAWDVGAAALKEFDPRNAKGGGSQSKPRPPKTPKVSDLDLDEKIKYKGLNQRFTGRERAFNITLSLWSEATNAGSVIQSLATRIESMMSYDNSIKFIRGKKNPVSKISPVPHGNPTMLWIDKEVANFLHLPNGQDRIMEQVPHLEKGQRSLGKNELSEGVQVGRLIHPIQSGREVRIPFEQLSKHSLLSGMTGTGKSSTAMEKVQSLIDAWLIDPDKMPGFTYMDPAQETVATILTRLLKAELDGKKVPWEKVHYAYLGATENPLGLNLLHRNPGDTSDEVAKSALGLLKYAYSGDTPRMDRLIENALLTLLEDDQPHTILGIVPILTDENFRDRILPKVKDPMVRQFWQRDIQDAGIDPILNRLSPLTTNKTMRRMFGQSKWSLNLRKYMDEGHIFLWDLLNVSEQNIKLTVGHLINQYHLTAKTRRTGSKKHFLNVDEAHLVQIPVMGKIIAEDRKFGLCLELITQYIDQFEGWLVQAILGNVGTIMSCTQGAAAAPKVSTMTAGIFDTDYLKTLPERVVAVYTKTKMNLAAVKLQR